MANKTKKKQKKTSKCCITQNLKLLGSHKHVNSIDSFFVFLFKSWFFKV